MKHLPVIILLTVAALVTLVTGCDSMPGYDGRLTAADALMHDDPDSALAIVEAVNPDSLSTEGDRAYRDLLLTQARYRCYITASNDSDINRALAYYRAHSREREKLTRAYIYKGAVMEELGHPDSAMLYYKHAEANADPNDYFNLGQINTRIASLYRIYFADKQTCYDKYQKALEYYNRTEDKQLQLNCLYNMGMCSSITGHGDSQKLLDSAVLMAIELNDSLLFFECKEMIVRVSITNNSSMQEAKKAALFLLENFKDYITYDLLLDLAYIYDKEHLLDSAKYYLSPVLQYQGTHENRIRIRAYEIAADIAAIEGNMTKSHQYLDSSMILSESINNNILKYKIQSIENGKNNEQEIIRIKERDKQKWIMWSIVFIFTLMTLLLIIRQYRRKTTLESIMRELNSTNISNLESFRKMLHAKESTVELLVRNMVSFIQTTIDTTEKDSPVVIRKRIKETIIDIANEDFWKELRTYLDKNHNNVISNIAKNPRINESDIKFLELACCGFSYVEMAITLGYSTNYVSNKRIKIQKKLNLKQSLQDYLNEAMKG